MAGFVISPYEATFLRASEEDKHLIIRFLMQGFGKLNSA
jgi:hypothetical protein